MDKHNIPPTSKLLYLGTKEKKPLGIPEELPIYPSTAYVIEDLDDYDFASKGGKYYYNRTDNPNRDSLAEAISWLENGEESLICSSGMAAISTTLLALSKSRVRIVLNQSLYGETMEFVNRILGKFEVEIKYADFSDLQQLEQTITEDTAIVYTEIITNPLIQVVDIEQVANIAHKKGAFVVVDSTFTTPILIKPLEHGADVVLHSLTKYFGGHSDITGGSITASQEIIKKLKETQILLGCTMDPNTAWLTLRSVRTMEMRVKKQVDNAAKIAQALLDHPKVRYVNHPSLPSHPQHTLATELFSYGYGPMLSFRLEDNREKVNAFIKQLQMIRYLGTLGGYRTSLAHPATAFRNEFSKDELEQLGMQEGLIRISSGIEEAKDIIADLLQALEVF